MQARCQILVILLWSALSGSAQDPNHGMVIQAKSTGSEILIRWAPTSPVVWQYGNTYGYALERVTLIENGKVLIRPISKVLGVFQPAPLSEWEELAQADNYVAVAAQSIYGERFGVTETFSSDIVNAINQSRVLENRFSFSLFCTDMSLDAARLSGLYFNDKQVHNDFEYIYRVYPNTPDGSLETDTASVLIGLDEVVELPEVKDFEVQFGDHIVELSWGTIWGTHYSGYWVEKSSDGARFEPISEVPIVNAYNSRTSQVVIYDSIADSDKEYHYRLLGIDYFGEKGPPSAVISGSVKPAFKFLPSIIDVKSIEKGVRIHWEVPDEAKSLISNFELSRQDLQTRGLVTIKEEIPSNTFDAVDTDPVYSNYYVVSAFDQYGRTTQSFPFFFQLEDSLPPLAPTNLSGEIDTLGRVKLRWEMNEEKDLVGYKLYVSNFPDAEFIQVPGSIIKENRFVDQIDLSSLTETVYYQVKALDSRFNPSEPSGILKLKKPDLIPPVPPVFRSFESDSMGIRLWWDPSSSRDVESYLLFRRAGDETEWREIKSFDATDTAYYHLDDDISSQRLYGYTLLAIDDDGLESRPSAPVIIKSRLLPRPLFQDIFSVVDTEKQEISITWHIDTKNIKSFHLYKSKNGKPLSLHRIIESTENEFLDSFTASDKFCEYHLLAVFEDGTKSRFSEKVKVEF